MALGNVMTSSNHDEFSKKFEEILSLELRKNCSAFVIVISAPQLAPESTKTDFSEKNCMLKLCTPESRVEAIEAV